MLDTNALSAWADGAPGAEAPLRAASRLVVPSVVLGEYLYGVRSSRYRERYEEWLRENLPLTEVAVVTAATAGGYADLRRELKEKGTPIPSNDLWIAALARQHGLGLMSNDGHFDAVPGLERVPF